MAARTLFLGIDVSTTGAKALLIDGQGTVVASASTALNVSTPRPLWSEQDPYEWWEGTTASIRRALARAPSSITSLEKLLPWNAVSPGGPK